MSKRTLGIAAAFVVGIVWMLAAAPAEALCQFSCTCESSCSEICFTGPFIQDCPECNQSTCGKWGLCSTSSSCVPSAPGCPAQTCTTTINGTSGNDTLIGGSAGECIYGFGGNDTMDGNAGNDCLDGGSGTDFADGGSGTDICYAESQVSCP
jgi:hypothetical protein